MGFICLPVSLFLFWLMLRPKREDPFPKGGLIRLLLAGAVSVGVSIVLNLPLSGLVSVFRLGVLSDPGKWLSALRSDPAALSEMLQNASRDTRPTFLWELISMFFTAGLLEEGLKFLTCRIAVRKEGMIRTRMDAVIAFAIVGITFEFLENIVFGMNSDFLSALVRSLGCAHFVFGVIMGWLYGKHLMTGRKKDLRLSFAVPVVYHTVTNALMASMELSKVFNVLGSIAGISHMVATVVTVVIVILWQKNRTLDTPISQERTEQKEQKG